MKRFKRLVAIGMIVCLAAVTLAGCGTKEEALASAIKTANEAKSMEAQVTMDMGMKTEVSGQQQDVAIKFDMNISAFEDPLKMKADISMDMGGMAITMAMYGIEKNGEYVQYINMGQLGGWMKQSIGNIEEMKKTQKSMNQLDAKLFMNEGLKYEKQEDTEEDGKKYEVYVCTLDKDTLQKLLDNVNSISNASSGEAVDEKTQKAMTAAIESMEGTKATIWIDPEEKIMYRVKLSLTECMQKLMQKLAEDNNASEKVDITKMDLDCKYKNYNKATDFEIPEEAYSAKDMAPATE